MKWFKVTIPSAPGESATDDESSVLLNTFVELFVGAGEPENTALFSSETSPDTFYVCATEHSIAYIQLLIESYNASPCHKPSDEKLALLAGKGGHVDGLLI